MHRCASIQTHDLGNAVMRSFVVLPPSPQSPTPDPLAMCYNFPHQRWRAPCKLHGLEMNEANTVIAGRGVDTRRAESCNCVQWDKHSTPTELQAPARHTEIFPHHITLPQNHTQPGDRLPQNTTKCDEPEAPISNSLHLDGPPRSLHLGTVRSPSKRRVTVSASLPWCQVNHPTRGAI